MTASQLSRLSPRQRERLSMQVEEGLFLVTRCRGRVTGEDWRREELQERYRGLFEPHVQSRIDAA